MHIRTTYLSLLAFNSSLSPYPTSLPGKSFLILTEVLFKIFGALSKDTYRDICKYFGVDPIEKLISVRQSKFILRYCASEGDVCRTISKLR